MMNDRDIVFSLVNENQKKMQFCWWAKMIEFGAVALITITTRTNADEQWNEMNWMNDAVDMSNEKQK